MSGRRRATAGVLAGAVLACSGCATSPTNQVTDGPGGRIIAVAASINSWGSILGQLGGSHVRASSIISNPATDPHDYEPTPADARKVADARVFVLNGAGYDSWATKSLQANPDRSRQVVNVAELARTSRGGNPHLWYDPAIVTAVADRISQALTAADPADADYFRARRQAFDQVGLAGYRQQLETIRARYHGVAVGASESVFVPLASALDLKLVTPARFLLAISEGSDPSAADKASIDRQLASHLVTVYVFNSQNATPDVSAQLRAARAAGIPVVTMTESLTPRSASFQDWQVRQLSELRAALARATGR